MSEVVFAFVDWCFREVKVKDKSGEEMGLTRVHADMFDVNKGSESVAKRAGFVCEGRSRASVWKEGIVMDQLLYAMTRDDWEKRKSAE